MQKCKLLVIFRRTLVLKWKHEIYFKATFLMHMVFILLQPVPSKLGTGVFKSPTQLSLQFMHIQMKCQKLYNQTKFTDSSRLVSAAFCICQGRSCSARRIRRQWKPFLAMKGYGTFMFAWNQFFSYILSANKK